MCAMPRGGGILGGAVRVTPATVKPTGEDEYSSRMRHKNMAFVRRTSFLSLAVVAAGAGVTALPPDTRAQEIAPAAAIAASERITAADIRGHVRFLSDDLLEGRGPATTGDLLAQKYIAAQFEAAGLEPGAPDGTFFQKVSIVGLKSTPPETVTVSKPGASGVTLAKPDFVAYTGIQSPTSSLENAEIVFVGYGIQAPEYQWDDYKGTDLRGKVLLMLNNDPNDPADPQLFLGKTRLYYGRWDYKYESAARAGAAGAIIVHTTPSAGYGWSVVQTSWSGEQFELLGTTGPRLNVRMWATEEASAKIASLGGRELAALVAAAQKRDFRPVPLGVTISLTLRNEVATKTTANVIGKIPGSDPTLRGEAVLFAAHHDHLGKADLGVGPDGKPKDGIFNGAHDNAVGVSGMIAIASEIARMADRPKRSMYFAAVAAEEKGLLGSRYLSLNLPVPAGRVAANVNMDSANIWGRVKDLPMIGYGKSSLDRTIEALAARQGRRVVPDTEPDKGFFYRSDQFNFAKVGIPAAYFHSGHEAVGKPEGWGRQQQDAYTAQHYHQPSDELRDWWNYEGALDDFRLCMLLGLHVANAAELPRWNPGDEFEAARRKAIAEAAGK